MNLSDIPSSDEADGSGAGFGKDGDVQAVFQMVRDTQGICHDGERGIHRSTGWEETAVDDIEIVQIMGFAMNV